LDKKLGPDKRPLKMEPALFFLLTRRVILLLGERIDLGSLIGSVLKICCGFFLGSWSNK
jgi:hypothetical protein